MSLKTLIKGNLRSIRIGKTVKLLSLCSALIFFNLISNSTSYAATFTVDRIDDATVSTCSVAANDCTLRGAVTAANTAGGTNTIDFDGVVFAASQTILLSGTQLAITSGTLTINGTGANLLTISGGNLSRIFSISVGATATITGLTVFNGNGGGTPNTGFGGGVFNAGTLTLTNVAVTDNQSSGGGNGGGVYNLSGLLTINNSTINSNIGANGGGGILNFSGATMIINNSTITENNVTIANGGGGIANVGTITVTGSTIANNSAAANPGGGVVNFGSFTSGSSIYADNTAASNPDFSGTLTSNNFNLIEDTTGTTISLFEGRSNKGLSNLAANDITGVDPMLGPLQNNGGTTLTKALLPGSPAIDTGNSFGLLTDQRGSMRPVDDPNTVNPVPIVGNLADIGAFEVQAPTAAAVRISGRVLSPSGRGVQQAIVQLTDQNGSTITARTNSFGYYRFEEVEVGQTLIFNVFSKRYQFATRIVNFDEETTILDFTGR